MSNVITVGSVSSADYGIIVLDVNDTDMPGRDYTVVSIPGRSRDLHYDNGRFNNIDRVYTCFVEDSDSFGTTRDTIAAFVGRIMRLKGYQRIECGLHPDFYVKGEFRGEMQPNFAKTKDAATFQLTFDCDARKYLVSGEQEITLTTGTQTVTNPGTQDAYPLFVLTGNGTIDLYGEHMITVANNPGTLVIDCELGDAYEQMAHTNYNQYVTFSDYDLFTLPPGSSQIQVTGFTSRKLIPRWCSL
jgi:phage-related protein